MSDRQYVKRHGHRFHVAALIKHALSSVLHLLCAAQLLLKLAHARLGFGAQLAHCFQALFII